MPTERHPLSILFSMRHLGSFRMYESAVERLAAAGHRIHVMVDRGERQGWHGALEQLIAQHSTITWGWSPPLRHAWWFELSRIVRIWLDYLRYFEPAYASATILRRRAADRMPRAMVRASELWPLSTVLGRLFLRRCLRIVERALPRPAELDSALSADPPDVLLITPLVDLGSPQLDLLRSAQALGVRTGLCIGSWDHLSSKALIRDVPQHVFVWNETQRREAVELHGIPSERVVSTGAQCYDQWFDRAPSRTRDAFCARVGLSAKHPFVLWTCSALFQGSPSEAAFVARWIESLRTSGIEALRTIGILVRPHPARRHEWDAIDLTRFDNVALYGSMPADELAKSDYFDSLYFSAAVAGLNTSAFLEAAIVGRPVHVIMPPEFHDNQEGTLHFDYLRTVGGGLVHEARDFDAHHRQLADSLSRGPEQPRPAFVEAFIRPHGRQTRASDVFASSVEALGYAPAPVPRRELAGAWLLRPALVPLALATRAALGSLESREDKISREILGARVKEQRARWREQKLQQNADAERDRQGQRDRERAKSLESRLLAKQQYRHERERMLAEKRQRQAAMREQETRDKQKRRRHKRLQLLRQRILHRLGLA